MTEAIELRRTPVKLTAEPSLNSVLRAVSLALQQGDSAQHVANLLGRLPNADRPSLEAITHKGSIYRSIMVAPRPSALGGPVAEMDKVNANRRAAMLINSISRVGRARNTGGIDAALEQLDKEERWVKLHLEASLSRERAARRVAAAAREHGMQLGWKAKMDERTTPDCAAANGRNFDSRFVPAVGYPGSAHPTCRCKAVRPFRTVQRVEDLVAHRQDWAA